MFGFAMWRVEKLRRTMEQALSRRTLNVHPTKTVRDFVCIRRFDDEIPALAAIQVLEETPSSKKICCGASEPTILGASWCGFTKKQVAELEKMDNPPSMIMCAKKRRTGW